LPHRAKFGIRKQEITIAQIILRAVPEIFPMLVRGACVPEIGRVIMTSGDDCKQQAGADGLSRQPGALGRALNLRSFITNYRALGQAGRHLIPRQTWPPSIEA
jgi:hypothetical protein